MVRKVDNFDLRGAFNYLVEDQDEGGMGLTRPQAESQIAQRLAKEVDFDYTAATEAGFNNEQIISKLTGIEDRGALSVLGEATARGAIGAIPEALTFVPGVKAGAALGVSGGPAGILGGAILGGIGLPLLTSIVDQQVGLTKSVSDFLLGEEEPVLPSDQPFREAGKVTGGVLSFSGALRRGLAKSALGDMPTGQAGAALVDTGADFGSKKILANLRKYDPDAKTPLSLRALQATEDVATRMATRARAPGRDYYLRQEVPIATAFGVGAGVAEQIDPGDAVTSFLTSLGAGLVVPTSVLSRITGGAAAKSAQAGQALRHPSETFQNILTKLRDKKESKARNDLIKLYEGIVKNAESPGRAKAAAEGVPYDPKIHSPNVDFTRLNPGGAAETMRVAEELIAEIIPGIEKYLSPGIIPVDPKAPGYDAYFGVLRLQGEAMNKNAKLKKQVSDATQKAFVLSAKTLGDAIKVGEPDLIAVHAKRFIERQENFIGELLHNELSTVTETLDKMKAKGILKDGQASEIIVRTINKLESYARDIEKRLYDSELIDYLASVKPNFLIKGLNEDEAKAALQGRFMASDIKSADGKKALELIEEIKARIPKADPTLQRPPKLKGKALMDENIRNQREGIEELIKTRNEPDTIKFLIDQNIAFGGRLSEEQLKKMSDGEFKILLSKLQNGSSITKRKSQAIPSILKPGIEPKVPRIRDIVRNIDPDFDEMSELVSSMGRDAKISRKKNPRTGLPLGIEILPSHRMKRGGESSIDGLMERAIDEGYFPGYGINEFTAGPGGKVLSRDEFYDALENNIAKSDDQVRLDEYQNKVEIAADLQESLDKAGIKNKDIRGMTDDELFELVADIDSGILPPRRIREQVGGFPKDMPAKERRRLDKELEAQAQAQAGQIQYDPDIPAQIMTVGDAIRIRSLIGDALRDTVTKPSERRYLTRIRKNVLKDLLENTDLDETREALILANTFTKAKNDVFSRTKGGEMAKDLKYSDDNVFAENLLAAGRPNELGNRVTGLQKFGQFFEDQATELLKVGDPELTALVENIIPISQNSALTIENSIVKVIRGMLLNGVLETKPQSKLIPRDIKKALPGQFDADQVVVNEAKLKTFMNRYKAAADQNPSIRELFEDMSDPVKAQQVIQGLREGKGMPERGILPMQERIDQKNALSDILNVDSPVFRILQILESKDPQTRLDNLIKQVNLIRTSNIPVTYKGKKVPAKEVFEPAVNSLVSSFIQVARDASYIKGKDIFESGDLTPIGKYDAKIFRQVFFETGEVFPQMKDLPSVADTLLKQGIIDKAKYNQIDNVTLAMERMQNQLAYMDLLPDMSTKSKQLFQTFVARYIGARGGSALGTDTIQVPGAAAGLAEDILLRSPNTAFISFLSELFEPGGYENFLKMLENTAEQVGKRQRSQAFETPLLVPPLKDSPLAVAAPVEAITRDREEERTITPPPPQLSQASPSVNPMQTANQRARYAAMFPLDPASSLIRERQAQGIGSLPRP
jgi:hypothetical protein